MNITLKRSYDQECVDGVIYDDKGKQICFSLELPDKGNQPEISCIPEGVFKFRKIFSSHLGWVYRLDGVEGRSLIDIHSGNYTPDLRGCICVGTKQGTLAYKGKILPAVLNSKEALQKLFDTAGTTGTITITSTGD